MGESKKHKKKLCDSVFASAYPLPLTDQVSYGRFVSESLNLSVTADFTFSAKEKDKETGFSYFGSRYYNSDLSIWLSVDPMSDKYPSTSPYAYCRNNPIILVDPNGMWDVKVSASADRGKNPYATFTVYDRNGNEVFKTIVMVKGLHRKRDKENGDTPTGVYKILEWRKTGGRYNKESYGENDLLALEYKEGAGEGNRFDSEDKRAGMHVHGGRKRANRLVNTHGCIRMADDDIKELKSITDELEQNDPMEKRGILVVSDDLDSPVNYSNKQQFKESVSAEKHVTLEEIKVQ